MKNLILLLPLLLVSCDQAPVDNSDIVELKAKMQSIVDARASEQAARDAIEAEEAAARAAIVAEEEKQKARQIEQMQTWRVNPAVEKGLTIMSKDTDSLGNYLVLVYLIEAGESYTGLALQSPDGQQAFNEDQVIMFVFDKVNKIPTPMRVTQGGELFAVGAEPRKALRGSRDLKVYVINPVTGERNIFSFDVRDFPASYFLIKS